MDHIPEPILPTPPKSHFMRRRNFGRFPASRITFIRDLQRLIKTSTRNRRLMSLNRLAVKIGVDPHLLTRLLSNNGLPDTAKLMMIARYFEKEIALVRCEEPDEG